MHKLLKPITRGMRDSLGLPDFTDILDWKEVVTNRCLELKLNRNEINDVIKNLKDVVEHHIHRWQSQQKFSYMKMLHERYQAGLRLSLIHI